MSFVAVANSGGEILCDALIEVFLMLTKGCAWMAVVAIFALLAPRPAGATDVDGGNDCPRPTNDFGDAPEGFDAYPGVLGRFPTCLAASPPGTQEIVCAPISTFPGPTGHVVHRNTVPGTGYWFGCAPAGMPPAGIDSEPDGKTSLAAGVSFCAQIPVDCFEVTAWGDYGQDECFGGSDAGLVERPALSACELSRIRFRTMSCTADDRIAFLNVLIDMNEDGDWNDNFECPQGCAFEWVLKNVMVTIPPGCATQDSPPFLVGPFAGRTWMRMSLSDQPVTDDFPWAGSAGAGGEGFLNRGETEDYPLEIGHGTDDPCELGYEDFGDAPEGITAYSSGVVGQFPTCRTFLGVGTQEIDAGCVPLSPPPGPTGFVRHEKFPADPVGVWWGCSAADPVWIDSEPDGKVNLAAVPGTPSSCDNTTLTDCVEAGTIPGLSFGQDECAGDGVDAGLEDVANPVFTACTTSELKFRTFNCTDQPINVFINLLFDWNEDGDWNDVLTCGDAGCAPEWAVVNRSFVLPPGCSIWTSPTFTVGPNAGHGWMRATMTLTPVPPDFPWNGSAGMANQSFPGGETEDYPFEIRPGVVGVGELDVDTGLFLARGTPNPTSTSTEIRFGLTRSGPVNVTVYDVAGRRVRTLVDGSRDAGAHVARWDLRNDDGQSVAPGIYLVRLEAEGRALTSRVTRIR